MFPFFRWTCSVSWQILGAGDSDSDSEGESCLQYSIADIEVVAEALEGEGAGDDGISKSDDSEWDKFSFHK